MKYNDLSIKLDNLPLTLPIFPVSGALLLPEIEVPLNVFEERYINLVDDALAEKRLIGMVQPKQGIFANLGKKKSLYNTGCVGRIKAFNETEDGRYLIVLSGISKFELVEEIATVRGYKRFKVSYDEYSDDLKSDVSANNIELDKETLLKSIDSYLENEEAIDSVLNVSENIAEMENDFLVDFLCCYLPFSVEEKQLFLEAKNHEDRAKSLLDVLGMAAAGKNFKRGSEENNLLH